MSISITWVKMLKGNLSEFNFGEVLQLVGKTRKTGAIKLIGETGAEGIVYIRNGEVYFSESTWKKKPIGQRLVESRKITREQLEEALKIQAKSGKKMRLGMILIDLSYISPQDLVSFVQEQILETVLDFFAWKKGEFMFIPNKVADNEDIGIKISIENLILQGAERLENIRSLQKFIPDRNIIFTVTDISPEENKVIILRPKELKVLRLIDGNRNIQDLLKDTEMGEFELFRLLFGLHAAGLVKKSGEKE